MKLYRYMHGGDIFCFSDGREEFTIYGTVLPDFLPVDKENYTEIDIDVVEVTTVFAKALGAYLNGRDK